MNKDEERMYRCIAAICDASRKAHRMEPLDPISAVAFLGRLWEGWENHWAYEDHYKKTGRYDVAFRFDITSPKCVAVYTHEVGIRGRDDPYGNESYVFSSLPDLCAPRCIEKYTRMLGDFAEIIPMWEDCPHDKLYLLVWSRSPRGAGNAMECRMELKRILKRVCPSLVSYASKIRSANSKPKHWYLDFYRPDPMGEIVKREREGEVFSLEEIEETKKASAEWSEWRSEAIRKPTMQPEEYRKMKKGQLWLKWRCPPKDKVLMAQVVVSGDPFDFWRIAAGQVQSVDVESMMVHQLKLL